MTPSIPSPGDPPPLPPAERKRAAAILAAVSLFWLVPGLFLLLSLFDKHRGESGHSMGNWITALVCVPFLIFSGTLLVVVWHVYRGTSWRRAAFVSILIVFPTFSAIAAWPLVAAILSPGTDLSDPVTLLFSALAAIPFGAASFFLWFQALTGKVSPRDIRGMTED